MGFDIISIIQILHLNVRLVASFHAIVIALLSFVDPQNWQNLTFSLQLAPVLEW